MMMCVNRIFFFFFFKQKTAYEITRRDWSSDVCSSDLGFVDSFLRGGDWILSWLHVLHLKANLRSRPLRTWCPCTLRVHRHRLLRSMRSLSAPRTRVCTWPSLPTATADGPLRAGCRVPPATVPERNPRATLSKRRHGSAFTR